MFGLGAGELLIIFVFALIFIGPKKLPELAKSLGKGLREFQKAKDDFVNVVQQEADSIESKTSTPTEEELVAMGNVEGVSHDDPSLDEREQAKDQEKDQKEVIKDS